jgi:hypothetical protein
MHSTRRLLPLLLLAASILSAQSGVTDARYAHLARGVNLTRWFQYGGRQPITEADRDLLKNAGFTSVRIALAPQYLLPHFARTPERIQRNLTRLDAGIDLFLNAGTAVMLDFQADVSYLDYYLSTPEAPQELIDTWRMLATRYANRDPELLFFEVMNEPDTRFTQAAWDEEQKKVLGAIREVAPNHTVLLAPASWSGLDALLQMTPYDDPNVIYVMHYYSPSTFTAQGADWTSPKEIAKLRNVPWPAFLPALEELIENEKDDGVRGLLEQYRRDDWNAAHIDWDIGLAAAWAQKWNARVVVNEFGGYKPFSPPDSRARWLRDVRTALDHYRVGWAMWDYAAGFDLILRDGDTKIIDPDVAAALGLQPWNAPESLRPAPQPPFSGSRTAQIGTQPDSRGFAEGILAADVNGDGLPDLITTPIAYPSLTEHPVQVFLNSGGGILQPAKFDGDPPMQRFVSAIVAGKFDRSGRPGFFLPDLGTEADGAQSKLILPSGKDALHDATANLPQQLTHTTGAAAGDVDGDGIDDLVVFHPKPADAMGMQLWRNNGTGRFRVDLRAFPKQNTAFSCGIFVGRDLAVFGQGGRILRNDGKGHFSPGAMLSAAPAKATLALGGCAAVADLNGDGLPDLLVGYANPDVVQVLINNGDGTFRDETDRRMGPLPASRSGLRRIALAQAGNSWTLVLTRPGEGPLIKVANRDGVFYDAQGWTAGRSPWVVAPADFNGDGLIDLAFAQGAGSPIVMRFGQLP